MPRLALVVLVALAGDASGDPPPSHAKVETRFRVLSKAERATAAATIAKTFPAELAPKVEVDFSGFPKEVTLDLPAPVATDQRIPQALAMIRAHAATFGVLDPAELPYVIDSDMIRIGAGSRWTGQIVVRYDDRRMTIYDHLWPVDTQAVGVPASAEALVKPFYGKRAEYRSKCLPGCGHDSTTILDKTSFALRAGTVLLCTPEGAMVRAGIQIERRYRAGSRVEGIDKLPWIVDAHTIAPLVDSNGLNFLMPGDGVHTGTTTTFGPQAGFATGGCFEP